MTDQLVKTKTGESPDSNTLGWVLKHPTKVGKEMQNKALIRGGVGLAAVALAAAACGSSGVAASGGSHPAKPSASMSSMGTPATTGLTATPAATLYAGLDELLTEHVDLTANVVQTAVTTSPSSAATKAALAALDQNTVALGQAFGSVYGSAAQAQFLKLWRAHIGFFVNYTVGTATHNTAMVATARKDLAGYITQFSAFVSGATKLPKAAVAADLQGHVSTLETAINAIVAGSTTASSSLLTAEDHMAGTGAVLAQGITTSMPSKFTS